MQTSISRYRTQEVAGSSPASSTKGLRGGRYARIVALDAGNGVVDVGERVRLRDRDAKATLEYELVGSLESDPAAGRISAASPVGRALLGRRKGEIAVVDAPKGRLEFEILEIEMLPESSTAAASP